MAEVGERCGRRKPCKPRLFCDPVNKVCVGRGRRGQNEAYKHIIDQEYQKALRVESRRHTKAKRKNNPFPPVTQKDANFHAKVSRWLAVETQGKLHLRCEPPTDFPYQVTVATLVSPKTSIDRFLVVHRTGAGKTRLIIHILSNYFNDPRPKILIFPNENIQNTFYNELFTVPGPYQRLVEEKLGRPYRSRDREQARAIVDGSGIRAQAFIAGTVSHLKAPLEALTYASAGGSTVISDNPRKVFKIPTVSARNPYDNKIILMDEVHNLITPEGIYRDKVNAFKKFLFKPKNSLLVGFTATPVVKDPQDQDHLLAFMKGKKYKDAPNANFVSYFNSLPLAIYPQVEPSAPDVDLPDTIFVTMKQENAAKYVAKAQELAREAKKEGSAKEHLRRLQPYCNTGITVVNNRFAAIQEIRKSVQSSYEYATKLTTIAQSILQDARKTLVLIKDNTGFNILKLILESHQKSDPTFCTQPGTCVAFVRDQVSKNPSTEDAKLVRKTLKKFNSTKNRSGERIKALVVNAKYYSEGISFFGVRRIILADVPSSYAEYKQQIGRVLRACSYQKLFPDSPDQRTVSVEMYVARFPYLEGTNRTEEQVPVRTTVDEIYLRQLTNQRDRIAGKVSELAQLAVDGPVLDKVFQGTDQKSHARTRRVPSLFRTETRFKLKKRKSSSKYSSKNSQIRTLYGNKGPTLKELQSLYRLNGVNPQEEGKTRDVLLGNLDNPAFFKKYPNFNIKITAAAKERFKDSIKNLRALAVQKGLLTATAAKKAKKQDLLRLIRTPPRTTGVSSKAPAKVPAKVPSGVPARVPSKVPSKVPDKVPSSKRRKKSKSSKSNIRTVSAVIRTIPNIDLRLLLNNLVAKSKFNPKQLKHLIIKAYRKNAIPTSVAARLVDVLKGKDVPLTITREAIHPKHSLNERESEFAEKYQKVSTQKKPTKKRLKKSVIKQKPIPKVGAGTVGAGTGRRSDESSRSNESEQASAGSDESFANSRSNESDRAGSDESFENSRSNESIDSAKLIGSNRSFSVSNSRSRSQSRSDSDSSDFAYQVDPRSIPITVDSF